MKNKINIFKEQVTTNYCSYSNKKLNLFMAI